MLDLQFIQFLINTVLGKQLLMGSLFPDLALMHDHNAVRMLDGGQTVSYHNGGPALHQLLKGLLDQKLRLRVDICRRFIHNKDLGPVCQRSGKG